MGDSRLKIIERFFAIFLAVLMVIGSIPSNALVVRAAIPNEFTFVVKDSEGENLDAVKVSYEISIDGETVKTDEVNTVDGEAVVDISGYEADIFSDSVVKISYTVAKNGYDDKSGTDEITDTKGSINVVLRPEEPSNVNVHVDKKGSGSIKMNGEESSDTSVEKDSNVSVVVRPETGWFISDVKINDVSENINNKYIYQNNDIVADSDISISVEFKELYKLKIFKEGNGTVTVDGEEFGENRYDETKAVKIVITPDDGYQIESLTINDVSKNINNVTKDTRTLTVNGDKEIRVKFIKTSTISLSYNSVTGEFVYDEECAGGSLAVRNSNKLEVKPNETYRIAKIITNEKEVIYDNNIYNENNPYKKTLDLTKDYNIEITFAPLIYNVTSKSSEHGQVNIINEKVDYNGSAEINVLPEEGYEIDNILVNDIEVNVALEEEEADILAFSISNVVENKEVEVIFKESEKADLSDVSFNSADAIRVEDSLYVFAKDSHAVFSTEKQGIKVIYSDDSVDIGSKDSPINIDKTKTVDTIKLKYDLAWHEVEGITTDSPINIVIDKKNPDVKIELADGNGYDIYNDNVDVKIKAEDLDEYSGIGSITYHIMCNGVETKSETIYTYKSGYDIKNTYSAAISVDANENNSDNVFIYVVVTDIAGNKAESTKNININSTKPIIEVVIDGERHSEAQEGYYNTQRTATIIIRDREDSFNENSATDGIVIYATDAKKNDVIISKPAMISAWDNKGDAHEATVTFNTDANYEWGISYTNKAGMTTEAGVVTGYNDGGSVITSGDSVFKFTVDKKAPSGSLTIEESKWNELLETITFGIFKGKPVTVQGKISDTVSSVYDIRYYKTNSETALTKKQLEEIYEAGEFVKEQYTIDEDEIFVVYARYTDYAGNTRYVGTNGVIVDLSKGVVDMSAETAPNEYGFYNSNINVSVNVNDVISDEGISSGIKTIDYKIIKDGDMDNPTQEGNLYTFDVVNPTLDDLTKEWTGNIEVDASLNNSDRVEVVVAVCDNAENQYDGNAEFSINVNEPKVSVNFDNNNVIKKDGDRGYFDSERTAIITIEDRASAFSEEKAFEAINIDSVNYSGTTLDVDKAAMISSWEHDGDIHTAYVYFTNEGNYDWYIDYTNQADNSNNMEVSTEGCVTPFKFTIDKKNPSGSITVNENAWKKLLNVITFGLFNNTEINVKAIAKDEISPVDIKYLKTDSTNALTEEELEQAEFLPYKDFSLGKNDPDEQLVIYLKVTDYAGHYIFVSSDGNIFDKTESKIEITPEPANENGIYGITEVGDDREISVDIKVADPEPYSGIKTVEYWVTCDDIETARQVLYSFDYQREEGKSPLKEQLKQEWTGTVKISAYENNSCNVVLHVKAVDNAGNESTEESKLDIDVTRPSIDITFDNNTDNNGNSFFNASRIATVVITKRPHHFDDKNVLDGINITAVDGNGNVVKNAYTIGEWSSEINNDEPDKSTFTAEIAFKEDAKYTFDISYTDNAGNENEDIDTHDSVSPFEFAVDTNPPTGMISVDTNRWSKLISKLTFGLYSKEKVDITAYVEDKIGSATIEYLKTDKTTASEDLDSQTFTEYKDFSVELNELFTVYLKLTDDAGNYTYISTDGYIVDPLSSEISFMPDAPNNNGMYGKNEVGEDGVLNVGVKVAEPTPYSGIKTIEYWITSDDIETARHTLYSFNYQREQGDNSNGGKLSITDYSSGEEKTETLEGYTPEYEILRSEWEGIIPVNAEENNSCNVVVYVRTVDNAGNENTKSIDLDIDVTSPEIDITFDNNDDNNDNTYFDAPRTATVVITERNHHFDKDDVKIDIIAVDAEKESLSDTYEVSWLDDADINNEDTDTHTMKIKFKEDANYEFAIEYTDKAGNQNNDPDTHDSVAPYKFTVDTTNPEGSVSVDKHTWNKLLNKITFGLYSKGEVYVSATASDKTSPVSIGYYIADKTAILTGDELDELEFTEYSEEFDINPEKQFVVYLKIVDAAGNYIYVSSDGYILDTVPSEISIKPELANDNGIYGISEVGDDGKVDVDVRIKELGVYSGIQFVEYWIICDGVETVRKTLYSFDYQREQGDNSNGGKITIIDYASGEEKIENYDGIVPEYSLLRNEWSGTIKVDAEDNNSCDVVVYVRTIDNAGNEDFKYEKLDIDITQPSIDITYDNNSDNNGNTYFDAIRTATIVITEREHHFDANEASNGIIISAVDINGNTVEEPCVISGWRHDINVDEADLSTYMATITYAKDANYTFEISYTDKAGNENTVPDTHNSVAPYKFTVDTVPPTGTVRAVSAEGRADEWTELSKLLTFGFWSNNKISVSGTYSDLTSPIAGIEYYKATAINASDATTLLTISELDRVAGWSDFRGIDILANEQTTVYLKMTDYAGNYAYISTNGLIVDDRAPQEESIAPEISILPQQPINDIYKGNVNVAITVTDPMVGGTYSGIREITYNVYDKAISETVPTQSEVLYSFANDNPRQDELLQTWRGNITVDSTKNNSNDIQIVVNAVDNSLNSSSDNVSIKIDTTAPVIDISYDNNSADGGIYFKDNRTATIVVTERNFNPNDVRVNISNTSGLIPTISGWRETPGTGNKDNTRWISTITYSADGDYTFAIDYTDLAGNICTSINYDPTTVSEKEFTIDKTVPVINVSYDNNASQNNNYYSDARTATIVITEHNFDASRVQINISAVDDGVAVVVPNISGWTTNGDRHSAQISYVNDALYTFDISCVDKAGNEAADFAQEVFYIDRTDPVLEIIGVENSKAYKGSVIPVIKYSDTNLDDSKVVITLTGVNRKSVKIEGTYSDIHNGRIFTFEDFAYEKEIDDIYTLKVEVTDKAGRKVSEKVDYSINRFGSTYSLSKNTEKLNGSYVQTTEDVVITEVNANKLSNIKITLFKNNQTIVLEQGTDYEMEVEGGGDQWYKYTYTIFKKNFEDDGVYRLTIHSEDEAGNVADNTIDTKNTEISFGVDKTPPTINIKDVADGETYALENLTAHMSVTDNLKLASVVVFLDGKEHKQWSKEEIDRLIANGEDFTFEISGDSTKAHTIRVVAVDEAGNGYTDEVKDFYITTDPLVRYYNNKPLFYGSISGVVGAAGVGGLFVALKRRKRKKEEEA